MMRRNKNVGEVGNMVIANGLSQLYTGARDIDPYSAFDDVLDVDGESEQDFSDFRSGATRRARSRMGGSMRRRRRSSRPTRRGSTENARRGMTRTRRTSSRPSYGRTGVRGQANRVGERVRGGFQRFRDQKNREARQQQELLAQAQKNAPTLDQINALLAPTSAPISTQQDTKMSPALKWGLIIGGVAVAATIGYVVYTRMKKKGK